jgi:hypothetical protein
MRTMDWLPQNHEALYEKIETTWSYLENPIVRERMGLDGGITTWLYQTFNPPRLKFNEVFLAWKDPASRTPLMIIALKDAESKIIPLYRELYTGFLKNNPLVTNTDLQTMGLPIRTDGHRNESSPVPHTFPDAFIDTSIIRQLYIRYRDHASNSRAKPYRVHAVEIRWAILEKPPTNIDELIHSEINTRSPFILSFQENERGKTVYFCLRWENTRGEKGPWSEITSAIIP